MRYFYDCEFLENGRTIDLISIGIVREDGQGYYAINAEMPEDRIRQEPWLMANVIPQLHHPRRELPEGHLFDPVDPDVKPRKWIAREVMNFLLEKGEPELWADFGAYDHVVLCQLFGRMIDLPKGLPMFTRDLQQRIADVQALSTRPLYLPVQTKGAHDALADACHLKAQFDAIQKQLGVM